MIIGVGCPLCDDEVPVDVIIDGTYLEKYFEITGIGEYDEKASYPRLYVEIRFKDDLDLDKALAAIRRSEEQGRERSRMREKRDAELGLVEPQT